MTIHEPDCALDVLTRSILMHPTLFAEACEQAAAEDRRYAAERADMFKSDRSPINRAESLEFAADKARNSASAAVAAMDIMDRRAASWIAAFGIACKLQCVPAHVRTAFAVKWGESQAELTA